MPRKARSRLDAARVRAMLIHADREPVGWADALTESAVLVFPTDRATGATPDPDDEIFLECALAGEADYFVSGDKKHLLLLGEFRGIRVVSPTEFARIVATG